MWSYPNDDYEAFYEIGSDLLCSVLNCTLDTASNTVISNGPQIILPFFADVVFPVNPISNVSNLGKLTYTGENTWESIAGLEYGPDRYYGNRVQHVMHHTGEDLSRNVHGVFTIGRHQVLPLIDEAWGVVQSGGSNVIGLTQRGARTAYYVDMGITNGYEGGNIGATNGNPVTSIIKIVIEKGYGLVTDYPIK